MEFLQGLSFFQSYVHTYEPFADRVCLIKDEQSLCSETNTQKMVAVRLDRLGRHIYLSGTRQTTRDKVVSMSFCEP